MTAALLITQCLQNDFVKPLGAYDSLPNLLHIGHQEARRLIGENPKDGPIGRMMSWAYAQPDEKLQLIHIRDWHNALDPAQATHLKQFGPHCLEQTEGARFIFEPPERPGKSVAIVNSITLNDFIGTDLDSILDKYKGRTLRVGLIGVWTEAKITFLAYELTTRYPEFEIAVCSALTASNSRGQHFIALDQLNKLLGVRIMSSESEFSAFLTGDGQVLPLSRFDRERPLLEYPNHLHLAEIDEALVRYLFRESQTVSLKVLDGGFSGNLVLGTQSVDAHGHEQAPHVVKIGPAGPISRERTSFERVESILGNNAPSISDFADYQNRGAIKYRYASMSGPFTTTLQKLFMSGVPIVEIREILEAIFVEQLGKFYKAAKLEKCNLLEYYCFDTRWAPSIRRRVEALLGKAADEEILRFDNGISFPNVCHFYENTLANLEYSDTDAHYFSYIHGDLNGANIIIDRQKNVWLIDFFHTHYGHVLKDLIKLENDLLYIFTPIKGREDFIEAVRLSDVLAAVEDLSAKLPPVEALAFKSTSIIRAYETVRVLRGFYSALVKSDRDPFQIFIGQLRYAVHTLSFDEPGEWQKRWALYTASLCAEQVSNRLKYKGPLIVNWLDEQYSAPGRLGLTILPGRKDRGRSLEVDIATLRQMGVTHLLCLLTPDELAHYGVADLLREYKAAGFQISHQPVFDQKAPSSEQMRLICSWLQDATRNGGKVVVHCVGGLGRSGTVAACFLKSLGQTPDAAIQHIRQIRSVRAIESKEQEAFIHQYRP